MASSTPTVGEMQQGQQVRFMLEIAHFRNLNIQRMRVKVKGMRKYRARVVRAKSNAENLFQVPK
jgi:hypothetical protein